MFSPPRWDFLKSVSKADPAGGGLFQSQSFYPPFMFFFFLFFLCVARGKSGTLQLQHVQTVDIHVDNADDTV